MTIRQPEEHPEPSRIEVGLLVHTHWDREWYRPFPQFRLRLVALIDEVLDGVAGSPFLLDGQAVVLEDYLEVRPERSADVSTALRQGAVEAGPWYVLADSLIPSGEGLVRNLLAGRRVLRSLRAIAPDVLYCPDSFGHPAALPAIAAGFGCSLIVLWRGYGGARHPVGDTAWWKAPDESTVLLYHLPPDGYEFGSHLPTEPDSARERWRAMRQVIGPRATTGITLVPVGADHHAPPANLLEAIAALKAAAFPDRVERVSLGQFGHTLTERAAQHDIPEVSGELRDSYGYTWTLQGTFSARAGLKRRYALVESMLLRDVEPWVALSRINGDGNDGRAILRTAWKPLLLCQPHDTLCGCSVDDVASAMAFRLDEATAAGAGIRDASIMALLGHDANAARGTPDEWTSVIVVRNTAARVRRGIAELEIDLVLDDAPVGPGSGGIEPQARALGALSLGASPVQEISRERAFVREESSRHYPRSRLVERRRVLAWVDDVPGYGLVTLPIDEKRRRANPVHSPVSGDTKSIEGAGLRVDADSASVGLTHDDVTIADWIVFEAEGERGDLYTHSAIMGHGAWGLGHESPGFPRAPCPVPSGSRTTATLVRAKVSARGPLRAELTCDWNVSIPERRLTSAAGEPRRAAATTLKVQTIIQLDAGAPFVRIQVRGDNIATDLRLRIGIRTGLQSPAVTADAAFGPVTRYPITTDATGRLKESAPATAPLHRYVSAYTATAGATVYSDGLAEYEADDDIIWITLLRAVGELSRHDLPERPGHAGYPVPTPAAQSQGLYEASLAFLAHGPKSDTTVALVEKIADEVLQPLRGATWRTAIRPPASIPGVELTGEGLACSTIKESEDGDGIVLRCVNVLNREVAGSWRLPKVREASLARLDETPLEGLPPHDGAVDFVAPPRGIVTILVR
ncbi:MAG TPA: glycosyl hydrolase-related protein [Gemmatimonadaceae bacterium]|nr:glycosyl hydrolase-related protein [Gemmatimonadaceae bacterium]